MQCSWRDPRDLFVQGAHHVLNLLKDIYAYTCPQLCQYMSSSHTSHLAVTCPQLTKVTCSTLRVLSHSDH